MTKLAVSYLRVRQPYPMGLVEYWRVYRDGSMPNGLEVILLLAATRESYAES
jgi:hypothetical protein